MSGNRKQTAARLARAAEQLDKKAGRPKCIATVVEMSERPGKVFMILMACPSGACARCDAARAAVWTRPPSEPKPFDGPRKEG
jgi:hypothetical protein